MALIMSNAGLGAINSATFTLDDQAPNQLPSAAPIASGTFQPTNYDFVFGPDTFSSPPAPVANPPSGAALAIFNGSQANGTWTLYIDDEDDDPTDTNGALAGGWSLRIRTQNGVPVANNDRFEALAGQVLTVPAAGVLDNDSDPDGDSLTALVSGQPEQGSLSLQPDGSFTYTPNKKAKGSDSFTYLAQDSDGLNALATVDIQVKAKKKHKKGRH